MKRFCLHQDQQSPFYGPVGHTAVPDDLLGRVPSPARYLDDLLGELDHHQPQHIDDFLGRIPSPATTPRRFALDVLSSVYLVGKLVAD